MIEVEERNPMELLYRIHRLKGTPDFDYFVSWLRDKREQSVEELLDIDKDGLVESRAVAATFSALLEVIDSTEIQIEMEKQLSSQGGTP